MDGFFRKIKLLLLCTILIVAIYLERASMERLTILIAISIFYVLWVVYRSYAKEPRAFYFMIDILMLFSLEYNSRYLINYFIHSMYIITLIENGIILTDRKVINTVGGSLAAFALWKFIYAVYSLRNAKSVSELLFNILILLLVVIAINLYVSQSQEKKNSNEIYKELLKAYKKLQEYSSMIEEVAVLEERSRITGEIHDSLGHRLTALIMQIEIASHMYNENKDINLLLRDLKERAREVLSETRQAVGTLRLGNTGSINDIGKMIKSFSNDTSISIDYKLPNVDLTSKELSVLYRCIQECITNAARHSKPKRIEVVVTVDKNKNLNFLVADDGDGGINKMGYGQQNMERRLKTLNGNLIILPGKPYKILGSFPISKGEVSYDKSSNS